MRRNCDNCGKAYEADTRNINRGWGLCCSKSCAASKREKSRPDYNPVIVAINDQRRKDWGKTALETYGPDGNEPDDWDPGDSDYWDSKD